MCNLRKKVKHHIGATVQNIDQNRYTPKGLFLAQASLAIVFERQRDQLPLQNVQACAHQIADLWRLEQL